MALDSLKLTLGARLLELDTRESLLNKISKLKQMIEMAGNLSFPGVEYFFDDLKLCWRVADADKARSFLKSLGWTEEAIDNRLHIVRTYPIATNYGLLRDYLLDCKSLFDHLFNERSSLQTPIILTFEPALNAGATPLADGSSIVTISSGFENFRRWFLFRQILNDYFPILPKAKPGTEFILTPDDQRTVLLILETLHLLSRMIMDNLQSTKSLRNARVEQSLSAIEELVQHPEKLPSPIRSEWRSAMVFVLCHELGHINLGHLDEIRQWRDAADKSPNGAQQFINRRREMENEADSYAFAHMGIMMATILEKPYNNLVDADKDPESMRDYILPIIDLFTLFDCGHKNAVNFESQYCPYPSYVDRLRYLLSKDGQTNKNWALDVLSTVKFIVNAPVDI